uniref:Uncharacterized protein n=1 Tax=Arundo donax TaxID=35708 RepID=A0A0A9BVP1_ARUDO
MPWLFLLLLFEVFLHVLLLFEVFLYMQLITMFSTMHHSCAFFV